MLTLPQDRRDVACLGLMVLVYGLVLGPVLHATVDHAGGLELPEASQGWAGHHDPAQAHGHSHEDEPGAAEDSEHTHAVAGHGHGHEHGHSHSHGKGRPHQHPWGAVEHLQAVALSHAVVLAPVVEWVLLRAAAVQRPVWVQVAPLRLTAMPQGP